MMDQLEGLDLRARYTLEDKMGQDSWAPGQIVSFSLSQLSRVRASTSATT